MPRLRKISLIIAAGVLSITLCLVAFVVQTVQASKSYKQTLTKIIAQNMQQQQYLLQRLGNNLLPALQRRDINEISRHLRIYEDILYTLAKQGLTIPASVHVVSFSAPQLIVGSYGVSDSSVLAPDEYYYSHVLEEPDALIQSHAYSKTEMPDYLMLNLGLGITDTKQNFYAQLDLKMAVTALQEYIAAQFENQNFNRYFPMFKFELDEQNLMQPRIQLLPLVWSAMWLKYMLPRLLGISALGLLIWGLLLLRNTLIKQRQIITNTSRDLEQASTRLNLILKANAVQDKYLKLGRQENVKVSMVCLTQLLRDSIHVNAEDAHIFGVQIKYQELKPANLCYLNQLRTMRILSGILYEMLQHMQGPGIIELEFVISEQQTGYQTVEVVFKDNGFYEQFHNMSNSEPCADIRCKGWQNICDLVAVEQGIIQHTHTSYTGNTVRLELTKKIVNNVVSLGTVKSLVSIDPQNL